MRNLLLIFIVLFAHTLVAQEVVPEEPKQKRVFDLTFRLDHSLNFPGLNMDYEYSGEYIDKVDEWNEWDPNNPPNPGPPPTWRMIDTTIIQNDWSKDYNVRNVQFDILVSVTERLNIGFGYNFTYGRRIAKEPIDSVMNGFGWYDYIYPESIEIPYFINTFDFPTFITLGPIVEYEFPVWKGLEITPSIFVGSYQSGSGLEGVGREFYVDARVAAEYVLWKRLGIRAYVAYDQWGYRENETSEIFRDQERTVKTDWNAIYGGLGLSYRFKLRPE